MRKIITECVNIPSFTEWSCKSRTGYLTYCECKSNDEFGENLQLGAHFRAEHVFELDPQEQNQYPYVEGVNELLSPETISSIRETLFDRDEMNNFAEPCFDQKDSILQCSIKNITHTLCECINKDGTSVQSEMFNNQVWSSADNFHDPVQESFHLTDLFTWSNFVSFFIFLIIMNLIMILIYMRLKNSAEKSECGTIICKECCLKTIRQNKSNNLVDMKSETQKINPLHRKLNFNRRNAVDHLSHIHPNRLTQINKSKVICFYGVPKRKKNRSRILQFKRRNDEFMNFIFHREFKKNGNNSEGLTKKYRGRHESLVLRNTMRRFKKIVRKDGTKLLRKFTAKKYNENLNT